MIVSTKDESLEEVVVHLLEAQNQTLAVAESCTGGLLSHRITNVSGCGQVFMAGLTTYSELAKQAFLGVDSGLIKKYTAVSKQVAAEMALGVQKTTKTDYALATTGFAGPNGGTAENPVGTVYISLARPLKRVLPGQSNVEVHRHFFQTDRENFKFQASQIALDLLRLELMKWQS